MSIPVYCSSTECVQMAVFMEIKKRTQTALLILGRPEGESLPLDISMTAASLEMKSPEDSVRIGLPSGLRIIPSSCRGVQYIPGDGLHLRLQVQAYCSTKLLPTLKESLKGEKSYVLHCQSCGAVIMKERNFLRVLPLPSENWNTLVEEWCCHADPFANKVLRPRENDCFVGDTHILVNCKNEPFSQEMPQIGSSPSKDHSAPKPEHAAVVCQRCKTTLGERLSPDTVKYYFTEIIIQPSCKDFTMLPRSCHVESVTAQRLAEFSSARSTFRFIIQGQDGKVYLLLWLLNSDTLLVETAGHVSGNIFTLHEDSSKPNSSSLKLRNALKVLFHPCTKNRNEELAKAWGNDTGVHSLTFPSHTCLELLVLLSSSNRSLPASLRCMNAFQVAFLKM
ncbi:E3 ubiquitin-protein ligase E3D isoform X1 [Lissotriton helveticus]